MYYSEFWFFFLFWIGREKTRGKQSGGEKSRERREEEEEKKPEKSKDDKESKEESTPPEIVQGTTSAMHEHFKHDFLHLLS